MAENARNVQLSLDDLYQINTTMALHMQDLLDTPPLTVDHQVPFELFAKTEWKPDKESRQASKAFRAVMADFVNFLDKAIFFKRCATQPNEISPLPKNMSADELASYLQEQVDNQILEIARDRRLTNPKKLAEFEAGLDTWSQMAASGYFHLRRCLEHHFRYPDRDIDFLTRRLTVVSSDRGLRPGDMVEDGAKITLSQSDHKKVFPANQPVQLSAQDVVDAAVTLIHVINPQIVAHVRRIHRERTSRRETSPSP